MSNPINRRRFLEHALKGSAAALALLSLPKLGSASAAAAPSKAAALPSSMELAVNLALAQPSGFRYNRPYVAVYIEDAQGNPVRTISLWAETSRHARYLSELRRWFSESSDLVPTVSSPTRNPGQYTLLWTARPTPRPRRRRARTTSAWKRPASTAPTVWCARKSRWAPLRSRKRSTPASTLT